MFFFYSGMSIQYLFYVCIQIRSMFNMKMFVETDPDSRLAKRMYKETEELGRDLEQVLLFPK